MELNTNPFGDPQGEFFDENQNSLPDFLKQPKKETIRNMLQGMTFNSADEAEAFVTSMLTDKTYEDSLSDVRQKLQSSQEAYPGSTTLSQMGGAAVPAVIASFLTKGKVNSPAFTQKGAEQVVNRFLPNLGRVMGLGALETAVSEVGAGEGGLGERIQDIGLTTTGTGGAISGLAYSGGTGLIKTVRGLVDAFRSVGSNISGDIVNREIQRIARESGLSPDKIAEELASGRRMSDNPVVAKELRALKSQGGIDDVFFPPTDTPTGPPRAGAQKNSLGDSFIERPGVTREEATSFIEQGLGAGYRQNTVRIARANEQQLKNIVSQAYKGVEIEPVNSEVYSVLRSALQKSKSLENKINALYRSETGNAPFFKWDKELDRYEFQRAPTNIEAEYLRRAIDAEAKSLLEAGKGMDSAIGANLSEAANDLRNAIDSSYSSITDARSIAANAFASNAAFKNGQRAISNFEIGEDKWTTVLESGSQDEIDSFRLGYLTKLKTRLRRGNKANFVKDLLDPSSETGMLFMNVFPEEKLDEALNKLDIAKSASDAYTKIFGNSITADILLTAKRQGKLDEAISFGTSAAMATTNLYSAIQFADRVISTMTPRMNTKQRRRVAEKLIQDNPQAIIDAMTDNTALGKLIRATGNIMGLPLEAGSILSGPELSQEIFPKTTAKEAE